MKVTYVIARIKMFLAIMLCLFAISSCISDGDETVVLETGNVQARKMLLGEWKLSSKTVVDEDGIEQSKEDISEEPNLEFTEDGNCKLTYPNGNSVNQKWDLSGDFYSIFISDIRYEIYTLGKNILVLVINYEDYYLKFVYYKLSSPEQNDGEEGEIGGTDDNNPYKPYSARFKVTKIVVDDKDTYTFEYDGKGRIMRYKTPSKTYTFTYDDTKAYLWLNGKIVNTGFVGSNGYLTKMWNGTSESGGVSTFVYITDMDYYMNYLNRVEYKGTGAIQYWKPAYSDGNMTFLYNDGSHNFTYTSSDNNFSVDLNGFISAMYQWEWFMHDAEVIWGLFDFYGVRSSDMVYQETTSQWNNTFSYYYGERGDDFTLRITQVRKGLNTNFTKIYKVYATNN